MIKCLCAYWENLPLSFLNKLVEWCENDHDHGRLPGFEICFTISPTVNVYQPLLIQQPFLMFKNNTELSVGLCVVRLKECTELMWPGAHNRKELRWSHQKDNNCNLMSSCYFKTHLLPVSRISQENKKCVGCIPRRIKNWIRFCLADVWKFTALLTGLNVFLTKFQKTQCCFCQRKSHS